ncbi:MAG TPA: hypothetical protein VH500_13210 [Nitrososphaeraceae archaeon]|jgi:hypothetical protein
MSFARDGIDKRNVIALVHNECTGSLFQTYILIYIIDKDATMVKPQVLSQKDEEENGTPEEPQGEHPPK